MLGSHCTEHGIVAPTHLGDLAPPKMIDVYWHLDIKYLLCSMKLYMLPTLIASTLHLISRCVCSVVEWPSLNITHAIISNHELLQR